MFADHIDWNVPLHWTVDSLLGQSECEALIARIDAAEPEIATINAPGGPVVDTQYRNNTRVIFDDRELAALLYERVRPHLPERLMGVAAVGANERFRCYRYAVGQLFAPHYDGSFVRKNGEQSLLTFMVYLNQGFTGGETHFLDINASVVPRAGMALLFQHRILHESVPVSAGVKYAIRSDIMYTAKAGW